MATGLGAITPLCCCSSVPKYVGFLEARIPLGVTMALLIASPMIFEVAVAVLVTSIGWKYTMLYLAAGVIGGL